MLRYNFLGCIVLCFFMMRCVTLTLRSVHSYLLLLRPLQIATNDSCWQWADLDVAAAAKVRGRHHNEGQEGMVR